MYRNSEHSESTVSSNTAITGQSSKLPREGINQTGTTPIVKRENLSNTRPIPTQKTNVSRQTRTGVHPRVQKNGQGAPQNNRQMTGSVPRVQNSRPPKRRKRPLLETILIFILRHKKAVLTFAACFVLACVIIPLAVYAAAENEEAQNTPDFELLETSPDRTDVLISQFSSNGAISDKKEEPSEKDTHLEESASEVTKESSDADKTEDSLSAEGSANGVLGTETKSPTVDTETTLDEPETAVPETEENSSVSETTTETVTETEPVEVEPEAPAEFVVTINFYDRESITCITGPATLYEIFATAGYTIRDTDSISYPLDEVITEDTSIMIDTVEYASEAISEIIPFDVETYKVQTIPRGTTQVVSQGTNGVREKVYTVKYVNGVEVERKYEYEYIATYPINQINHYGTGGTYTAADGSTYSYSYYVTVRATYYNIHGTTASGMPTAPGVIATDPNVFPLGTQLYVVNSTFDMGVMTAADTGGAVKGNIIDIWMDETSPHFAQFAAQGIWEFTAYVLG